jgi:hypothetical protein
MRAYVVGAQPWCVEVQQMRAVAKLQKHVHAPTNASRQTQIAAALVAFTGASARL